MDFRQIEETQKLNKIKTGSVIILLPVFLFML